MKSKKILSNAFLTLAILSLACLSFPGDLESANFTSVKDTLTSSMLSFHAKNATALNTGSIIQIAGSGTPSTDTSNLFPGDTIKYTTSTNTYTVDQIIDSDEFSITSALDAADDDSGDEFVVVRTTDHDLSFTTATSIPNGAIRVRIKADSSNFNDGNPDDDGFDFNSIDGSDITCPTDDSNYNFVSATATVSGGTGCASGYHCFECRYSGTGAASTAMTMTIGASPKLINPSAASGHSVGTADTYTVIVENLNSSDVVIDSTDAKIAVIEAVRVSATVDPTVQLTLSAVAGSQTRCGQTTKAASTATSVPFGSLSVASAFGNIMAQQVSAVTNASSGYVVTVAQDDQLSIDGAGSTELADTDGDSENATTTTSGEWSSETDESGWGYSIQNVDAHTVPFQYNTSSGNCTGTFCARPFPLTSGTAATIMSNSSTPTTTEDIYMCYKIVVDTAQTAGDYENRLVYTATATF